MCLCVCIFLPFGDTTFCFFVFLDCLWIARFEVQIGNKKGGERRTQRQCYFADFCIA